MRSALAQNAFHRSSLRYEPSAYRSKSGSVNVAPARHTSAAPVAAACRQRSKLRSPRSARQSIAPVRCGTTAAASYRLVTTILDPDRAPAAELAALYHERWEIETAFDEFKTHLRGAQRVLRSKTPELVAQEAWGFLLAHFAIRALMHEAALGALPRARDPDTLSFTHALRVTRRTLPHVAVIPPSGPATPAAGAAPRARRTPRGARQLQSGARRASRRETQDE